MYGGLTFSIRTRGIWRLVFNVEVRVPSWKRLNAALLVHYSLHYRCCSSSIRIEILCVLLIVLYVGDIASEIFDCQIPRSQSRNVPVRMYVCMYGLWYMCKGYGMVCMYGICYVGYGM